MKVNELFLKAIKDKGLRTLIVASRPYHGNGYNGEHRIYMYLCIEEKSKYSDKQVTVYVDTDTEIKVDNYSGYFSEQQLEVSTMCWNCSTQTMRGEGHVQTFLNAIKKDSEVHFRVIAYNGCDYFREKQLVHHQLYGYIGEKCYFLSDYVGAGNTAAPVQGTIFTKAAV